MNVLNVNNILDPVSGGGTAERTLQLSRALQSRGVACSILTLDIGINGALRSRAGDVRVITLPCRLERYFLPSLSWNTISELVYRADVVQLMNHWTILNAMVFRYLRGLGKPYVVCPAGAIPIFGRSKRLKNMYDSVLGKKIILHAARVIAISRKETDDIERYGVEPGKITLIPNGVDGSEYLARDDAGFHKKYGIPDEPFLLFMGRLNAIKGPDLLLDAFIRVAREGRFPHHLVFAGPDAGMLSALRQTSVNAGVAEKVHFIGYVGGMDKSHTLHAADILAIPSRQEAMSIVVLEAGAAGLPVLITDQCGFDDIAAIKGGIVTEATPDGIYGGLVEMLGQGAAIGGMGDNLRQYVTERFMWDNTARLYLELFDSILNRDS
jgi:glycosyltransferase involved in cell wall biosynthesis